MILRKDDLTVRIPPAPIIIPSSGHKKKGILLADSAVNLFPNNGVTSQKGCPNTIGCGYRENPAESGKIGEFREAISPRTRESWTVIIVSQTQSLRFVLESGPPNLLNHLMWVAVQATETLLYLGSTWAGVCTIISGNYNRITCYKLQNSVFELAEAWWKRQRKAYFTQGGVTMWQWADYILCPLVMALAGGLIVVVCLNWLPLSPLGREWLPCWTLEWLSHPPCVINSPLSCNWPLALLLCLHVCTLKFLSFVISPFKLVKSMFLF